MIRQSEFCARAPTGTLIRSSQSFAHGARTGNRVPSRMRSNTWINRASDWKPKLRGRAPPSVPPAFHDQTTGITFQLSPCRAVGGCRVLRGMLGQGFSWMRTALNLESWTPRSRNRKRFLVGPPLFLGRVFGVRFRSPSCGCRFGSEPGRFWVCVCRLWSGFSSGGVQLA